MRDYIILDIPNLKDIQNEILNFIPIDRIVREHSDIGAHANIRSAYTNEEILTNCPSLKTYFVDSGYNIELMNFLTNLTQPYTVSKIHTDGIVINGAGYGATYLTINIPILNCENTKLCLYEVLDSSKCESKKQEAEGKYYIQYDESSVKLIDEFYTDKPYLLNTSTVHNFTNLNPTIRYILLCRIAMLDLHGVKNCITALQNVSGGNWTL